MKPSQISELKNRFEEVNERIEIACQSAGRKRDDVTLIVVTKRREPQIVASLVSLGVKDIGENYVQEVMEKQAVLGEISNNFRWHLIGPLQRRKAKLVPDHFSMMHSVDRYEVAKKLDDIFVGQGESFPVMMQINVSGEESKSGWALTGGKPTAEFDAVVEQMVQLRSLDLIGLMTMPPFSTNAENSRQYFVQLRKLTDKINLHLGQSQVKELSMGTSFDYEVAIQEGATYVRIGEAILGARN